MMGVVHPTLSDGSLTKQVLEISSTNPGYPYYVFFNAGIGYPRLFLLKSPCCVRDNGYVYYVGDGNHLLYYWGSPKIPIWKKCNLTHLLIYQILVFRIFLLIYLM